MKGNAEYYLHLSIIENKDVNYFSPLRFHSWNPLGRGTSMDPDEGPCSGPENAISPIPHLKDSVALSHYCLLLRFPS